VSNAAAYHVTITVQTVQARGFSWWWHIHKQICSSTYQQVIKIDLRTTHGDILLVAHRTLNSTNSDDSNWAVTKLWWNYAICHEHQGATTSQPQPAWV